MNWNISTEHYQLRLPITEQDGDALFELLSRSQSVEHIPQDPWSSRVQSLDDLRRVAMKFQAREAVTWLVEDHESTLKARISVYDINGFNLSAKLRFELHASDDNKLLQEALNAVVELIRVSLGLHRLELRLLAGHTVYGNTLAALGFEFEGCLPMQLEWQGRWISLDVYSLLLDDRSR